MVSKEEHIKLSDDFFRIANQLLKSEEYAVIALCAESLLASLDHIVDAHLVYLGKWNVGRTIRYERFRYEVIDSDVYIQSEEDRYLISNTINQTFMLRDRLLYARDDKLYKVEDAKRILRRLIEDGKKCRSIIKEQVL